MHETEREREMGSQTLTEKRNALLCAVVMWSVHVDSSIAKDGQSLKSKVRTTVSIEEGNRQRKEHRDRNATISVSITPRSQRIPVQKKTAPQTHCSHTLTRVTLSTYSATLLLFPLARSLSLSCSHIRSHTHKYSPTYTPCACTIKTLYTLPPHSRAHPHIHTYTHTHEAINQT
jgi:hypothetical protein